MSRGEGGTYRLCKVGEVPEGGHRKFVINGSEVLLLVIGGELYCIEPICTHLWADLSRGAVDGRARTIECPLHGAIFDIPSGEPLMGPFGCDGDILPSLRRYKLRIVGDEVHLEKRQEWGEV